MNNQQTTLKEYQTQSAYATLNAAFSSDQIAPGLDELVKVLDDDHGMPYSGDHLPRSK